VETLQDILQPISGPVVTALLIWVWWVLSKRSTGESGDRDRVWDDGETSVDGWREGTSDGCCPDFCVNIDLGAGFDVCL
jgi:hypothetical protein